MHRVRVIAALLAFVVLLGACSSSGGGSSGGGDGSSVFRTAFSFDPGPLDPDVFYDGEGLTITLSVYEGLVRYKSDSTPTLEPWLAERYQVSEDGLTYTFKLRSGVKFHDGTEMTSESWKFAIERRKKVNSGPAYLVADVAKVQTPDPLTLVIRLRQPVSSFLHFLASPYGVRAVSPTAVKEHEQGDDAGQKWLATHDAGTGPYQLTNVVAGQSYAMRAFDGYWGRKPAYRDVQISMVPNFTTQQLKLQGGELDAMLHGVPTTDLARFGGSKFQIVKFPSVVRLNLWINPGKPPFDRQDVRLAVAGAIDRQKIVSQVYADTASTARQMLPSGSLPDGLGSFEPKTDPSELSRLAASLPNKKVDLAYTTDDPLNAQVAELVQTQLSAAGLQVTTRGVTQQTTFAWPTKPAGRASMLILPANPDAADGYTWPNTFYSQKGGLSYFSPGNVERPDALVERGLRAVDPKDAQRSFAEAADLYRATGNYLPLADLKEVAVARAGICDWKHDFSTLWTVRLAELRPC